MYNWEISMRENRMRKDSKNPSFSSTLLDEIYREIDGGDERYKELKQQRENMVKKQSSKDGVRGKTSAAVEDEEVASFRRACLIEKWMEKQVNEKFSARQVPSPSLPEFYQRSPHDSDPMFFSSSSCSSDSSFGGFSSSENESFDLGKSRSSCFSTSRPKPVKTRVQAKKLEHSEQSEFYFFDDCRNHQTNQTEQGFIKSKTRALKIYDNLKKVKQPISPGGRLTSFINSIFFTHGHGNQKKKNKFNPSGKGKHDQGSKCSSASSFSRSCLSKTSPKSREKLNNGTQRTVRFFPVSVILDEDSRPCGQKCIYEEDDFEKFGFPYEEDVPKSTCQSINDENDDAASDSSSDLFELDHLSFIKNDRFCEDLPVYETTHFDTNCNIAIGLIC